MAKQCSLSRGLDLYFIFKSCVLFTFVFGSRLPSLQMTTRHSDLAHLATISWAIQHWWTSMGPVWCSCSFSVVPEISGQKQSNPNLDPTTFADNPQAPYLNCSVFGIAGLTTTKLMRLCGLVKCGVSGSPTDRISVFSGRRDTDRTDTERSNIFSLSMIAWLFRVNDHASRNDLMGRWVVRCCWK